MTTRFTFSQGQYNEKRTDSPFAMEPQLHDAGVNGTIVRAKLKKSVWDCLGDNAPPNSTTDVFAVKISRAGRTNQGILEKEFLEAMKKYDVDHKHLVICYTCFEYQENLYFVMPLANGHLNDFMRTHSSKGLNAPSDGSTFKWLLGQMHGLAGALESIHKPGPGLIGWHHDVKPENILYFETAKDGIEFRITDWTTAKICEDGSNDPASEMYGKTPGSTNIGWPAYLPYETLLRATACTPDIWSLGCVFLELFIWFDKGYEALDHDSEDAPGFRQRRRIETRSFLDELKGKIGNPDVAKSEDLDVFYAKDGSLLGVVEAEISSLRKTDGFDFRWNDTIRFIKEMLLSEGKYRPTADVVRLKFMSLEAIELLSDE